jgi:DNA-binding transcriptional MocR family regulator
MRLNYSYSSPDELREGVRRLAGVLGQLKDEHHGA